ncbi:MAG: ABC transporter permease subunit [Actinomycetales bacterium]|jgi:glycine betaine/proline transport system permease protein|nr:MAG: ABC transporter permease subunit [Actinomycetales bacterium]
MHIKKPYLLLGSVAIWILLGRLLHGKNTLQIDTYENTSFTRFIGEKALELRGNRTESPAFIYFFNPIRAVIDGFVQFIRNLIAVPAPNSVIPVIGWLGVVALIAFAVFATSALRTALLSVSLLLGCGVLGMWQFTMDSIAMTLAAVLLSLSIGIPLGIWAGLSDRVLKILTPFLDLAQILPTLVYMAPIALVFMIGAASATIATMIYAIPICIRITSHAIRNLNQSPVEASESMGSTRKQTLTKVQIPMAKQMIVLGINQTVMAAVSFVVVAALIGAPGLGKPVIEALIIRNVGQGFVAGFAVVFLAILMDRSTSAAAKRQESFIPPTQAQVKRKRITLIVSAVAAVTSVFLSRTMLWAAVWPKEITIAPQVEKVTNNATAWVLDNLYIFTVGFKDLISYSILNPLETQLSASPWYVTVAMIVALALIIAGLRTAILAFCLAMAIVLSGLWYEAMLTLTQTIVGCLLTMVIGIALGIWTGRSDRAEKTLRPFLDAGQTLPAFVYLVPMLGLFGPTRFTAIATGIVYAIPVVVKIVCEGIRAVPHSLVEAATAAGSTTRQIITKVQLPAAKKTILLATNQGLIYVLAVVVIGGFVGAGGLGYLVIVGNSKPELQGKGLIAGAAILLLGVIFDRIMQAGAKRSG